MYKVWSVGSDTDTVNEPGKLVSQEFVTVTVISPSSPKAPVVTVTFYVLSPLVILHPVGKFQL